MSFKNHKTKRWEILYKNPKSKITITNEKIVDILLKNRGIKTVKEKKEFFKPTLPEKLEIRNLGINEIYLNKAIKRIQKAFKDKEKVIIYGDYDADGICASAILWEALYSLGLDVTPYIPERFSEGYGINFTSVEKLKSQYPDLKLIITVDNGIVAAKAINKVQKLGIDVIITDHHLKKDKLPSAFSIIHTVKTSGSGIAWILAREILRRFKTSSIFQINKSLELVAIGTIADQIPLIGANRSFAKYGLVELNDTQRYGLNALFREAGLKKGRIGSYAIGFLIAPRLNAMGRVGHAIYSLRLLCTKSPARATELAIHLGRTNAKRQKVVEEVLLHAKEEAILKSSKGIIVLSHESYHEGVIGLAAAKLVEEFWRPAIVLSRGKNISKASARSIPGFNIIEFIQKYDTYLEGGGGHPMAAGFSIKTEKIAEFSKLVEEDSEKILNKEMLTKTLKADLEIDFNIIDSSLLEKIKEFEPVGLGNPIPIFVTKNVDVLDAKTVGIDSKHLKLKLKNSDKILNGIAFGMGEIRKSISPEKKIDIAYGIEENNWNGDKNLEVKIKDIKF